MELVTPGTRFVPHGACAELWDADMATAAFKHRLRVVAAPGAVTEYGVQAIVYGVVPLPTSSADVEVPILGRIPVVFFCN